MVDNERRRKNQEAKERIKKRIHVEINPDNYEYFPEKKRVDYYDNDVHQNVGIYVRVSTDDVSQTTSYELQRKYYEEFVIQHPLWTLVNIYADEGISGTTRVHRDAFNQMVADAKAGKIDLIITKSVSRFSRNTSDFLQVTRELSELRKPVGVFFESECIFSLNEDSQMPLSFFATMAEQESRIRSRSMEASLRMRLDHGIPLTPKLLGYTHDQEGKLIVNQDEAPTVKLAFYMYLFGYSTQQIADALIALGRKSYLGNIKWTASGVTQILRNERHCGDVLTRKTFKPFKSNKTLKNRGDRPQSKYKDHHEAIISRDDFIAVQRMLDNAKYGNKSILPELRVIKEGVFKGFVTINPRWSGFKEDEYYAAAQSIRTCGKNIEAEPISDEIRIEFGKGDLDLRGFEIARSEFFDSCQRPRVTFGDKRIKFNTMCVRKLGAKNFVELLVNPIDRKFAMRIANKDNRNGVVCSRLSNGTYYPKEISAAAFIETLYNLFGWNLQYKYRMTGSLFETDGEIAYVFDAENSEAFLKRYVLTQHDMEDGINLTVKPLTPSGKHIRAIPEQWTKSFGEEFYLHQQSLSELDAQSEADWKLRMEGQLVETGKPIHVTGFEELRTYIKQELSALTL